jgi:hypothetical protein
VSLEELPGLNAVKLTATAEQVDGGWSLNASGTITPNIPGITTSITGTYKDGIFLADGKLKFNKGKLAGDFRVVVTNGPVPGGEGGATDGGGAAPSAGGDAGAGGGELAVWGRGSATLKITDWLQGKATLALEPDGNVKVDGEISTPGAIELWKGKSFDHEIFKLGVDIPILGFSVAGQRVGVFANITGGAGIHASIGPVQLKDAKLGVAYDFATDMITSVSGHALIDCPAEAGLNLFIRAGIGVGAPIISAQGGLKASADVGVKGGISQELTVDWTPQAGLKIDTTAKAVMKPSLTLTLSGFCLVEADLLVKTVTLYEQEWKLAGFEVGSDLEFGVEFPVKYEEGKSFDVSLSDIKFITPDIDGGKLAKGAMDAVV